MPRPKGFSQEDESNIKSSRSHAFRNALVEAGEAVLTAAAEGNQEQIVSTARKQLRAVRREFANDPVIFRILPPQSED
jgi:hypothetical protein